MDTMIDKTCPKCGRTVDAETVQHLCGKGGFTDLTADALEIAAWARSGRGSAADYMAAKHGRMQ